MASSKSVIVTLASFLRTAKIAPSFNTLAKSAPENPGVRFAKFASETSLANFLLRACTCKIASRPLISGKLTVTRRSKRPLRSKAGSNTSGRFVAAITTIPALSVIPSISTNNWFNVCSRSSFPPPIPAPR